MIRPSKQFTAIYCRVGNGWNADMMAKTIRHILHELVEKIIVYAPDKSSGHRTQQIDIYYNFVGKIPLSQEVATRETA